MEMDSKERTRKTIVMARIQLSKNSEFSTNYLSTVNETKTLPDQLNSENYKIKIFNKKN